MSARKYNAPLDGNPSDIGEQFNEFYYQKKALIEAREKQYFMQLSDVTNLPKNMGKAIKRYHYLPLLDDGNINSQGIDANGIIGDGVSGGMIVKSIKIVPNNGGGNTSGDEVNAAFWAVGTEVLLADAVAAAEILAISILVNEGGFTFVSNDNAGYLLIKAEAEGMGWVVNDTIDAVPDGGNLYGSSKDVGAIQDKMPLLSETGGRVNRVGFTRVPVVGSIEKFGFFDEYSAESMNFDTDAQLAMHINREMVNGAYEVTEDALQIDLLNAAGVVRYGGEATAAQEMTGEGVISLITYQDLSRLSIDLDDNKTPKNTKIITGSRLIDTKVINTARYMYIGTELQPVVEEMTNTFGEQAFISVQHYAAAATIAVGEIGTVGQFRMIVVPKMLHYAGTGALVTANEGYRESGGYYSVYPMLVVGSESFQTIGFQTDGKTVKFKIKHVKPESDQAYTTSNPYGEIGFMSIKWYYGILINRSERIAVCKSVAPF